MFSSLNYMYTFPLSWYGDYQFYNYPTYQRTTSWTWKFGRNTTKIGFLTFNQCLQQQVAATGLGPEDWLSSWGLSKGSKRWKLSTSLNLFSSSRICIRKLQYHRMGVTPEIGTSRSGNLLLQALIEGKKSYFCCISSKFSCPRSCSLIGWIITPLTQSSRWEPVLRPKTSKTLLGPVNFSFFFKEQVWTQKCAVQKASVDVNISYY
jgi:hypothetical protein